jgi:hypothetical protein
MSILKKYTAYTIDGGTGHRDKESRYIYLFSIAT